MEHQLVEHFSMLKTSFRFKGLSSKLVSSFCLDRSKALQGLSRIEPSTTSMLQLTFTQPGPMLLDGQYHRCHRYACIGSLIDWWFLCISTILLKTLLLDTIVSGSILYWMIGLGQRASASNFFVYLSILFVFASLMNQQMAMFASFATEAKLQVYSAITLFFAILFSGFIVPVDTIPSFFLFLYWLNPFAWAYNAALARKEG